MITDIQRADALDELGRMIVSDDPARAVVALLQSAALRPHVVEPAAETWDEIWGAV